MSEQRTKIVATIGPASFEPDVLRRMIGAGMDVARLNFSHGEYAWHRQAIANIRAAAAAVGTEVGIIADLQGPRIRTALRRPLEVSVGETVSIVTGETSAPGEIGLDSAEVVGALRSGQRVFIEDGSIRLRILRDRPSLQAEVLVGGTVENHKGVNLPDTDVPLPPLTEKDLSDLHFALERGVDFAALSFVRRAADIQRLRREMAATEAAARVKIIAKIERPEAIDNLDEIIEAADAVMVARGDLATETLPAKVVILQKDIIARCLKAAKPVIVATEMLAGMQTSPRPTRAEISDVTNAVIDHADAVMLSGETAAGRYPLKVIETMRDIIEQTEISPYDDRLLTPEEKDSPRAHAFALLSRARRSKAAIVCPEDEKLLGELSSFRPTGASCAKRRFFGESEVFFAQRRPLFLRSKCEIFFAKNSVFPEKSSRRPPQTMKTETLFRKTSGGLPIEKTEAPAGRKSAEKV
ncbi:MAG TPA: pyruvate kinase [Candidatus Moranbacteria bacterium]|nr:pyruvate kinase [Candidatus Moranbacteria bacterium]